MSDLEKKYEELQEKYKSLKEEYDTLSELVEPNWASELKQATDSHRERAFKDAIIGLSTFEKGKSTEESKDMIKWLEQNTELHGFCPSLMYFRYKGEKKDIMYCHPWGQITLLIRHKRWPLIIMANSSIKLNSSALSMDENKQFKDIFDVEGFTG